MKRRVSASFAPASPCSRQRANRNRSSEGSGRACDLDIAPAAEAICTYSACTAHESVLCLITSSKNLSLHHPNARTLSLHHPKQELVLTPLQSYELSFTPLSPRGRLAIGVRPMTGSG